MSAIAFPHLWIPRQPKPCWRCRARRLRDWFRAPLKHDVFSMASGKFSWDSGKMVHVNGSNCGCCATCDCSHGCNAGTTKNTATAVVSDISVTTGTCMCRVLGGSPQTFKINSPTDPNGTWPMPLQISFGFPPLCCTWAMNPPNNGTMDEYFSNDSTCSTLTATESLVAYGATLIKNNGNWQFSMSCQNASTNTFCVFFYGTVSTTDPINCSSSVTISNSLSAVGCVAGGGTSNPVGVAVATGGTAVIAFS